MVADDGTPEGSGNPPTNVPTFSNGAPPTTSARRPPNVLVVVMDCARAKAFAPSADGPTARTPVIDGLARRGTRFPHAVAPANWTVPSHMSLFTGTYPNVHGVRTFRRGAAPRETLAAELGRRGYDTALFTEMVHLVAGYGLEDGFVTRRAAHFGLADEERTTANRLASNTDVLYSPWMRSLIEHVPPAIVPLNFLNHPQEVAFKRQVCGEYVVGDFAHWLAGRDRAKPFHAFFNLVDTHEPYAFVPNGHRVGPLAKWYARTPRYYLLAVPGLQQLVPWNELLDGYHRSVEAADAKIGRILEALSAAGEADRTLVVITADHGQSFGEGGNVFHGCGATDSITRVPLVVAPPAEFSLPSTVDRWTSLCDVFSWAKATAFGRPAFEEDGRAPMPFAIAAPSSETVYCEGAPASDPNRSLGGVGARSSWNHRLLAAYREDGKYVVDLVTGELVHWPSNVREPDTVGPIRIDRRDAAEIRRLVFGGYEATEAERRAASGGAPELATDVDSRLRSWGYD